MLGKVFSSLKSLGFKDVDKLEIYQKKEEKVLKFNSKDKKDNSKIDVNTLLYDRKVKCPVCGQEIKCRVVKSSVARIKSKDTDTFIRYDIINPYLYDVWVCPICGYAALKSEFSKLRSYQINDIRMKISNEWHGKEYPSIYTEEIAIERYKLALLTAVVADFKDSRKAILCLRLAWMNRILEKKEEEQFYLKKAIEGFLSAYANEDTPIYGLDTYSLMYLIGELYRRVGNLEEALKWFSNVIVSRGANYKTKDKARDMKDLAKEMMKRKESEENSKNINNKVVVE